MVRLVVIRREETAWRVLRTFKLLGDSRLEYPWLEPEKFFTPGTYPANPRPTLPKLYAVVLHPGKAWYAARASNRPQDVALEAAGFLVERYGLWLDWAAGYRPSGAVWLFVKPYAYDRVTGKRVWFRPTPEDLEALRKLCPVPAGTGKTRPALKAGRERERER